MHMGLILCIIASIAGFIGSFLCFIIKKDNNTILTYILGFSAGVMFYVSIFDLLTESKKLLITEIEYYNTVSILSMFAGFIIVFLSDKLISKKIDDNLLKVGFLSIFILMFHNIPEGMLTFITSNYNLSLAIILCISIALHNIPEGLIISIPIFYSTGSKKKALFYTFIASISEIIGALICMIFFKNSINNLFFGIILSITAGIMIYLALFELLSLCLKYKKNNEHIVSVILGFTFIALLNFIFK